MNNDDPHDKQLQRNLIDDDDKPSPSGGGVLFGLEVGGDDNGFCC